MRIAHLYRYPVKGLSPEPLDAAELEEDGYFPCDRLFALENGPCGFGAAAPAHQPKIKFLMLMRHAALASLQTRYDESANALTLAKDGAIVASGDLSRAADRATIEEFLTNFLGKEIRGPVRLLRAPENFRFTDSRSGFVSLVNLASVAQIAEAEGRPVDPLRFRANIYLEDLDPWAELAFPGRTLMLGGARLEILKLTNRCAATCVEPGTGIRDMDIVQTMRKTFGHIDCGVYARVVASGRVAMGDRATLDERRCVITEVAATVLPPESLLLPSLSKADFHHAYTAPLQEAGLTPTEIFLRVSQATPRWVAWLLALRNRLARLVRLKDVGAMDGATTKPAANYRVGDRLGFFSILETTEKELVVGIDDRHLDVRVSVLKVPAARAYIVSTVVHIRNRLGRCYMVPVSRIHPLVVRVMMASTPL